AGIAALFVAAGLVGSTVRDAYVALTDMTIILYFIPYLYLFGSYLRLRRVRTWGTALTGWAGFGAVVLSIVLALVPPGVAAPWVFRAKVVGGVAVFMGVGWWLASRGVRQRTASGVGNL
ncbi:MAG TPA: hypothetical protein VF926_16195, partial [Mycobacterium sp.]